MSEISEDTPAKASTNGDDDPWSELIVGLFGVPGIPWLLIFSDSEKLNRWWLQAILVIFWVYAITSLVAGAFGLWALYVRKQSREDAIAYADDKAAGAWVKSIVWGFVLVMLGGLAGLAHALFTNVRLGEALIVTLLTCILAMLVVIYDLLLKGGRK